MLRILVVSACLLVPAISFGQAGTPPTREIVLGPDGEIDGKINSPTIDPIVVKDPAQFSTLIHVRQNFNEKVIRSASEL